MSGSKRRAVAWLGIVAVVVLVLGGAVAYKRLGGWEAMLVSVQLSYLAHVAPLMWPADGFATAEWKSSAVGERYRFAKSLIRSGSLMGLTPAEVSDMLGGEPSETDRAVYPLRRTDSQNLWWVLVLDFEDDRVVEVRREIAWLDP